MGCGVFYSQVNEIDRALNVLRLHIDLPGISEAMSSLTGLRGKLMAQVGLKYPRSITALVKLLGLSPGSVTLFHDLEAGWLVDARVDAKSPPVYHYVNDDVAVTILSGKLTHELEAELMKPDEYLGE